MKNNNFDFLRLYFAFIVVVGHLIIISNIPEFQKFSFFFDTYTSVMGFFCISGYLITKSYTQTNSLKKYFVKRIARLLPAYVIIVTASALGFSLISSIDTSSYFTHPQLYKYLISNLTFLNFVEPCLPGVFTNAHPDCSINGALWTIKIEVGFYIIIPLLLFYISKSKQKLWFFIIMYLCSIVYRNLLLYNSDAHHFNIFLARQLPGFISYFTSGIALFYYKNKFIEHKGWLFFVALIVLILEKKMNLEILTPLAFGIIIFTVAFSFKFLNSIIKFGDISYGIYLFHCPIIKLFASIGLFNKYNPYLAALFTITVIIIIGLLSWHLLEKKILSLVRKQDLEYETPKQTRI